MKELEEEKNQSNKNLNLFGPLSKLKIDKVSSKVSKASIGLPGQKRVLLANDEQMQLYIL